MVRILLLFVFLASACFCSGFLSSKLSLHRGAGLAQRDVSLNWKVTVKHGGKETELEVDENTSILEASLEAGIDLPHDCDLGVCLTCPAFIESGTADQSGGTLDDSVIEKGFALTCQSYPRSDIVIRSIEENELIDAQFERDGYDNNPAAMRT